MTISPIQPIRGDYVTKGEFNKKFEEQKEYMDDGFDGLGKQIDTVEKNLCEKIDSFKEEVNQRFDTLENKVDDISMQVKLLTKSVNNLIK